MEAFLSTHSRHPHCFSYMFSGYKKEFEDDANQVMEKIEEIVHRGRYRT